MRDRTLNIIIIVSVVACFFIGSAGKNVAAWVTSVTDPSAITQNDIPEGIQNLSLISAGTPARQALDAVGGKDVKLGSATQIICGESEQVFACSYQSKVILVQTSAANRSYDFWYPIMMHEYAHQIQFQHWDVLQKAPGYASLFNKNMELLADCMAASKITDYVSNYGYNCTDEQKQYGADAWSGVFS